MYHGTTYSRAKSIVAEGWIYRTNGNRAVYRNTEPGFVSLAARPIEAAEFAARAYLNERLHNGCCFSERMRKLFRKNEKNVLRFCNKKAKEKRRLQRVKKPM